MKPTDGVKEWIARQPTDLLVEMVDQLSLVKHEGEGIAADYMGMLGDEILDRSRRTVNMFARMDGRSDPFPGLGVPTHRLGGVKRCRDEA